MKKVLMVILFALALSACDDGGMFDPNTETVKADSVVRLEATGMDLRVYEFTPQTDKGMQCVFVAGEKKGGTFCWRKAQ